MSAAAKELGAYYTPEPVVRHLVAWGTRNGTAESILDPSCGDGRFLVGLEGAVGIDVDAKAVDLARAANPGALIVRSNFFEWANATTQRFNAVVGNPPFIRYQRFNGNERQSAKALCSRAGVTMSGLSSSWAPFVVGASSLLTSGGRLAFVVPAEISYAVYARPIIQYLVGAFGRVQVLAVQEKLFPHLSEDCWLLRADGYGGKAKVVEVLSARSFSSEETKWTSTKISVHELRGQNFRLRSFLLPGRARELYNHLRSDGSTVTLGAVADLGIGYVTGANDFFHLAPSQAQSLGIAREFLAPTVRTNRDLRLVDVDEAVVQRWESQDKPYLLLRLDAPKSKLPREIRDYLDGPEGFEARRAYKCRNREPWYRVPDVRIPDGFLSIMSSVGPRLVGNSAGCSCTNSVHAVRLRNGRSMDQLISTWDHPLTRLSCEVEGHHLGGGLLKLEPVEARNVVLPLESMSITSTEIDVLNEGIANMKEWRGILAG